MFTGANKLKLHITIRKGITFPQIKAAKIKHDLVLLFLFMINCYGISINDTYDTLISLQSNKRTLKF